MAKETNVNVNPIELQKALKGMHYPAGRNQLKERAEKNKAPEKVMNFLEMIPDREYDTPADLQRQVSKGGVTPKGKSSNRSKS
jgi:hypothetical protein